MRSKEKQKKTNNTTTGIKKEPKNLGKIPKTETKTHDDEEKEPLLLYPPPLLEAERLLGLNSRREGIDLSP
ncbi:hypothetical protein CDAR_415221 [Caerostris darwini]|uniref:Uncharacterized protein n=1 Tax=Caerostris darwini TaxID=1538125 RepID=A0AAV4UE07_9ARAC|nr:hypothetical protein CDAR_415221 [Caerostris darwini]